MTLCNVCCRDGDFPMVKAVVTLELNRFAIESKLRGCVRRYWAETSRKSQISMVELCGVNIVLAVY